MTYRIPWKGEHHACWLREFSPRPCEGALVRAHLIPKQTLLRELPSEQSAALLWDDRVWVPACGGLDHGADAHHGDFDNYRLAVPRSALPQDFKDLLEELGLGWYIDTRRFT